VRRAPLGTDRHHRAFWWGVAGHAGALVVQADAAALEANRERWRDAAVAGGKDGAGVDGGAWAPAAEGGELWLAVEGPEVAEALPGALDARGTREKDLKAALEKVRGAAGFFKGAGHLPPMPACSGLESSPAWVALSPKPCLRPSCPCTHPRAAPSLETPSPSPTTQALPDISGALKKASAARGSSAPPPAAPKPPRPEKGAPPARELPSRSARRAAEEQIKAQAAGPGKAEAEEAGAGKRGGRGASAPPPRDGLSGGGNDFGGLFASASAWDGEALLTAADNCAALASAASSAQLKGPPGGWAQWRRKVEAMAAGGEIDAAWLREAEAAADVAGGGEAADKAAALARPPPGLQGDRGRVFVQLKLRLLELEEALVAATGEAELYGEEAEEEEGEEEEEAEEEEQEEEGAEDEEEEEAAGKKSASKRRRGGKGGRGGKRRKAADEEEEQDADGDTQMAEAGSSKAGKGGNKAAGRGRGRGRRGARDEDDDEAGRSATPSGSGGDDDDDDDGRAAPRSASKPHRGRHNAELAAKREVDDPVRRWGVRGGLGGGRREGGKAPARCNVGLAALLPSPAPSAPPGPPTPSPNPNPNPNPRTTSPRCTTPR
jgi:hypothetical protein